jgi:hypothetical protein
MAVNFVPSTDSARTYAGDEISGVVYPRMKPAFGEAGSATDVSLTNPYPIAPSATNFVFSALGVNSTTTQLAAGATFTGTVESTSSQQAISVLFVADQNCTIVVKQYIDAAGARLVSTWTFSVPAGTGFSEAWTANGNYYSVNVTNNGGSATTTLNLNSAVGTLPSVTKLGNAPVSLDEMGGTALAAGQSTMAASIPVVIASNQTAVPVSSPVSAPQFVQIGNSTRTELRFYAVAAAAGTTTTETAITLTKSSGTSSTTTGTSFVITSGKRFKITHLSVATRGNATATAQTTTFNFRVNTAGAVTTTSTPIILAARSATPATANAWDRYVITLPADGLELVGDGTAQFGITAAATYTTNAPTWDVTMIGYEY